MKDEKDKKLFSISINKKININLKKDFEKIN